MKKTTSLLEKYGMNKKQIKKISPNIKNLEEHISVGNLKKFGDPINLKLSISYIYDDTIYRVAFDPDYSGNAVSWIHDGPDFEDETDLHYIFLQSVCDFLTDTYGTMT